MKYIPLTRGFQAIVDDRDYRRVSALNWYADVRQNTTYAATTLNQGNGNFRPLRLHNFITGYPRVDHKNHDGLDNRRCNLRAASQQQNTWNALPRKRQQLKGVTFQPRLKKRPWQARIAQNGHQIHLGYYATAEEAATAYDDVAKMWRGEFAHVNGCDVAITDNYLRKILSKEITANPNGMGRILIATLSCGHRRQWLYCKRAKVGAESHCSVCKEAAIK